MDRRQSTMIQVYRDEEGTVDHPPFLPSVNPQAQAQPRWAKKSQRSKRARLLIASGALATLYLVFCAWFAYAGWENFATDDDAVDGFPHRKFPWPFPKHPPHPPKHPKPPHHRPPFPKPTVLACAPVPTPSSVSAFETVELNVTLPFHKAVVLHDHLLHGNVSVLKAPHAANVTEMSGNKTLEVAITVANRTWHHPHPHPPKSVLLGDMGEEEKEEKKEDFLLCAITFGHPHHPPGPPPEELEDEEKPHPPPHPHPHPPFHPHPVIVTVLPAHNSTYPKLPGHRCPHHPPPGAPPPPGGPDEEEDVETHVSVFNRTWQSTISFLFPMLSISSHPHPHPPHPPPFPPPPPPPPFEITSLTVSVPHFVPVKYGLPFKPAFHPHWRH